MKAPRVSISSSVKWANNIYFIRGTEFNEKTKGEAPSTILGTQ